MPPPACPHELVARQSTGRIDIFDEALIQTVQFDLGALLTVKMGD
jgi:hypothetical protein